MAQRSVVVAHRGSDPRIEVATRRQPQIQALRAIAVASVIVYHFWPDQLAGGYVGVDVFFVISGYLMTKSILHIREDNNARFGSTMREFYARRAARILPAALITLLLCAAVVLTIVGAVSQRDDLKQILASSFFVENWYLASNATDYLGASATSPVQHFWSLSVEEQFYAVWPLIVFAAARTSGRVTAGRRSLRLLACFGGMTLVSLLYSIHYTATNASVAYFSTGTRFWELSFGAFIFVVDRDLRLGAAMRALLGWVGLALIAYAVAVFDAATPFPSWHAALPVGGSALVILSSPMSSPWGPGRILAARFPQWIGDISYSMYLLHYPVLILATQAAARGSNLGTGVKLLFLPLITIASALMKRWVEDRFRRSKAVRGSAAHRVRARGGGFSVPRTILVVAAIQLLVIGVTLSGLHHENRLVSQSRSAQAEFVNSAAKQAACFAAISAQQQSPACPQLNGSVLAAVPSPLDAKKDWPYGNCQERGDGSAALRCDLVKGTGATVVVAGDSHTTQWLPAILPWAKGHNYSLSTFLKSGCPLTATATWGAQCVTWNENVLSAIEQIKPPYILTSAVSALKDDEIQLKTRNLVSRWQQLTDEGSTIIAIRDIPQPYSAGIPSMPGCVVRAQSFEKCQFSETDGLHRDIVAGAAGQVVGSTMIDLASMFCPARICQPEIDGILVWIDGGHMSSYFARGIATVLAGKLDAVVHS